MDKLSYDNINSGTIVDKKLDKNENSKISSEEEQYLINSIKISGNAFINCTINLLSKNDISKDFKNNDFSSNTEYTTNSSSIQILEIDGTAFINSIINF